MSARRRAWRACRRLQSDGGRSLRVPATNIAEVVRAKNTLEATLEALPDAVVLLDAESRILSMNRAAETTCDATAVDRPTFLRDLRLPGLDHAAVARAISTGTDAGAPIDLTRTIAVDRAGTVQRLLPRVVPVPGSGVNRQARSWCSMTSRTSRGSTRCARSSLPLRHMSCRRR